MSDYVSELRRDLVGAAARRPRRSRRSRARPLRPRAWSPTAVAGALAAAAVLAAVVLALTTLAPPPKPSDAKVVAGVQLGGSRATRCSPPGRCGSRTSRAAWRGRPVTAGCAQIPVGGTPVSVAADGHVVWVMSNDSSPNASRSHLIELDARSGKSLERVAVHGFGGRVGAGAGGSGSSRTATTATSNASTPTAPTGRRSSATPVTRPRACPTASRWAATRTGQRFVRVIEIDAAKRPGRQPGARGILSTQPSRHTCAHCSPTATASGRWTKRAVGSLSAWRAAA